jgi:hypothetical protein
MGTENQVLAAKLEQRAHDARINVELAAAELMKLEQQIEARKSALVEEGAKLDEQLEAARRAKTKLETEAQRLTSEAQSALR